MQKRTSEEAFLPVKLSDNEKVSVAIIAAKLRNEVDAAKTQAAMEAKTWKDEIKKKDAELCRYLSGVQSGMLEQTVDAERVIDEDTALTWIEYEGERYQVRELTAEERSGNLFGDE